MRTKSLIAVFCLAAMVSCCCTTLFGDPLNNWHWHNPPTTSSLSGVVFANGEFCAVGSGGVALSSPDGTNWTLSNTATTQPLYDIIYANGEFVAVGNSGVVETSSDGEHWTLQTSGTTASLDSVAYGNGKFVVVGGSAVISSANAVNWTTAVSGLSGAYHVAGSSSGFVAINGSTNAYFSADGLNWVTNALPVNLQGLGFGNSYPQSFNSQIVTYVNGVFLVGGRTWVSSDWGDLNMFASSDGKNWPTNAMAGPGGLGMYAIYYSFAFTGSTNIIVGGMDNNAPILQTSTNGLSWSQFSSIAGAGNAGAYGNGVYVAVSSSQAIYTSLDGTNWSTQQINFPTGNFFGIASSNETYVVATTNSVVISTNDATYVAENNALAMYSVVTFSNTFVGVGPGGAIYQSTNGFSWTAQNSGTANDLTSITAGGVLVAVGNNGTILTSPSGSTWTTQSSGTPQPLSGITYSNGIYVAVGRKGAIDTSPDAINWTAQVPVRTNLFSVTYGSAGFMAVGQGGTILTSPDGVNWTQQNSGTSVTLQSASFGNGYYLVTGANAVAMTSPDGSTWTQRNIGATSGQTLYGSAFLNGCFDVVGSGGTISESDPVPPLLAFQMTGHLPQRSFKIFATPGMSYRILSSPNLAAGPWSTVDTVNNAAAITLWTNSTAAGNQSYFRLVSP